jgi:hypothetical protein
MIFLCILRGREEKINRKGHEGFHEARLNDIVGQGHKRKIERTRQKRWGAGITQIVMIKYD